MQPMGTIHYLQNGAVECSESPNTKMGSVPNMKCSSGELRHGYPRHRDLRSSKWKIGCRMPKLLREESARLGSEVSILSR